MDKKIIRKEIIEKRNAMTEAEVIDKSRIICDRIIETSLYKEAEYVLAYYSVRNEVCLDTLMKDAFLKGKKVCLPVVVSDTEMVFARYDGDEQGLVAGSFGIKEPVANAGNILADEELVNALVIMPLVAFDEKCNRIGYGGGYYDRFLSKHNGLNLIAVGYELQKTDIIDAELTDEKPDYIFTENEIIRPSLRMPGEFEDHRGCVMVFPQRPGSWKKDPTKAQEKFTEIAKHIARSEEVFMLVSKDVKEKAALMTGASIDGSPGKSNIKLLEIDTDDAWARDTAPTFVYEDDRLFGVNWKFNAWGGDFDGLYTDYENDDRVAKTFCALEGYPVIDADPFVLEGGSIASDGEGTVMVTESCLLSPGRNPNLSKTAIEDKLKKYLGAAKILWLPYGIYNDETNEHVDNVCAFVKPGKVLLAWTDDIDDPQYEMSKACLDYLENETDAKGRKIEVVKLPVPKKPVTINKEDMEGFEFEEGEDEREEGERLAASYVNFYIANGSIILPQFDDENDKVAVDILRECFPEREVVPVMAREIIVGGGCIHCITQQVPKSLHGNE